MTLLSYVDKRYGGFVSIREAEHAEEDDWKCLCCGSEFIAKFPDINMQELAYYGECPMCHQWDSSKIVQI